MSNAAITVEGLSKAYRIGLKEEIPDTMFAAAKGWLRAPLSNFRQLRRLNTFEENGHDAEDTLWALKDVSFEVAEGEVVGIIGRNGAGKSTLLKVLSRITEPTRGEVWMRGRVSSLLEVGTGFHPELTGRENVYMNGTILGMRKREIDRKFDEIVDFSGVEKFLDTPVKRYSSGMKVRLAFAVAAHLEPEILIIDEVLAVGDAEFQRKCLGKMQDVAGAGRTVLFVSHNMGAVSRLCYRAMLLTAGRVAYTGDVGQTIDFYLHEGGLRGSLWECKARSDAPIQLIEARVGTPSCESLGEFPSTESIRLRIKYVVRRSTENAHVAAIVHAIDGTYLFSTEDTDSNEAYLAQREPGCYEAIVDIPTGLLSAGDYYVRLGIGINGETAENIEALSFTITETRAHRRANRRRGYFCPELCWSVARTADV